MKPKHDLVLIHGRLGKNPDLRYTPKQEAICIFSVAENIEGEDGPRWHRVVVWGKQAEQCPLYLKKGSPVFVRGQKVTRSFTDKEGNQRGIEEIQAQSVGFTVAN